MENQNLVFFEPDAANPLAGTLIIDKASTLDAVYRFPKSPGILKNTLEKMVTWHVRNETTVEKALRSLHRFPQFQAYLMAAGVDLHTEKISIPIGSENINIHYADIRATPADEPIVSAFVYVKRTPSTITDFRISITGAHTQSPYLLTAANQFLGKPANNGILNELLELASAELKPESDYLGSAEYRLAMAQVVIRRAFVQCMEDK